MSVAVGLSPMVISRWFVANGDVAGNTGGVGAGLEFGRAWAVPGVVLSSAVRICGLSLITARYQGEVLAS